MANTKNFSPEFKANTRKALDGIKEPFNKKAFAVKMPESYAQMLLEMSPPERTKLMRRAIIAELEKL